MKLDQILDKKTLNLKTLSKKHKVPISDLEKELKMGIDVEHEHTSDSELAKEIALDHLKELPNYYTKLKKMEKD